FFSSSLSLKSSSSTESFSSTSTKVSVTLSSCPQSNLNNNPLISTPSISSSSMVLQNIDQPYTVSSSIPNITVTDNCNSNDDNNNNTVDDDPPITITKRVDNHNHSHNYN